MEYIPPKGKKGKRTLKNMKELFGWCLTILLSVFVIYLLSDKPLQGMDAFTVYVGSVMGLLGVLLTILYPRLLKKLFRKAKEEALRADLIFDETGVHVWENPEKGIDRTWDQFADCFISSRHIFVLFTDIDYTLIMSNDGNTEEQVLEALKLGGREDIIVRFEVEKRFVRGLI